MTGRSLKRSRTTAIPIGLAVRTFQLLRRCLWRVTQPITFGVRAIPVTPSGTIILIRHTYTSGWHLPGGARLKGEPAVAAVVRELREEIGLTDHGDVGFIAEFAHRPDFKRDTLALYVVRDVRFRPRLSLEVDAIGEFSTDRLPSDLAAMTRRCLALFQAKDAPATE